jgi:hypothetical protein
LSTEGAVFWRSLQTFHHLLLNSYQTLLAGASANSAYAKTGREFMDQFKMLVLAEIERQGLEPQGNGAQLLWSSTSLFRDLLMQFARLRPDEVEAPPSPTLQFKKMTSSMRMGRVDERVVRAKGHSFLSTEFDMARTCDACSGALWMLEVGYTCRICSYTCHKHCYNDATPCREAGDSKVPSMGVEGVFGMALQFSTKHEQRDVPILVETCIGVIEQKGLSSLDLYRHSAPAQAVNKLKSRLAAGNLRELEHSDVHAVTSVLKSYFRSLPEPLVPFGAYSSVISITNIKDEATRIKAIYECVFALPPCNHATLTRLVSHLAWVAQRSKSTGMTSHALAVVFGPALIRAPQDVSPLASLNDIGKQTQIIQWLIDVQVKRMEAGWKDIHTLALATSSARKALMQEFMGKDGWDGEEMVDQTEKRVLALFDFLKEDRRSRAENLQAKIDHIEKLRLGLIRELSLVEPYKPCRLAESIRQLTGPLSDEQKGTLLPATPESLARPTTGGLDYQLDESILQNLLKLDPQAKAAQEFSKRKAPSRPAAEGKPAGSSAADVAEWESNLLTSLDDLSSFAEAMKELKATQQADAPLADAESIASMLRNVAIDRSRGSFRSRAMSDTTAARADRHKRQAGSRPSSMVIESPKASAPKQTLGARGSSPTASRSGSESDLLADRPLASGRQVSSPAEPRADTGSVERADSVSRRAPPSYSAVSRNRESFRSATRDAEDEVLDAVQAQAQAPEPEAPPSPRLEQRDRLGSSPAYSSIPAAQLSIRRSVSGASLLASNPRIPSPLRASFSRNSSDSAVLAGPSYESVPLTERRKSFIGSAQESSGGARASGSSPLPSQTSSASSLDPMQPPVQLRRLSSASPLPPPPYLSSQPPPAAALEGHDQDEAFV